MQDLIPVRFRKLDTIRELRQNMIIEIGQEVSADVHLHVSFPAVSQQRLQCPEPLAIHARKLCFLQAVAGVYAVQDFRELSLQDHPVENAVFRDILDQFHPDSRGFPGDCQFSGAPRRSFHLQRLAESHTIEVVQQRTVQTDALQFCGPSVALFFVMLLFQNRLTDQIVPGSVLLSELIPAEVKRDFLSQRKLIPLLYRFHQTFRVLQDVAFLPGSDPESKFQPVPCVLKSRFQADCPPCGFILLLLCFVRTQDRMPVSAPETVDHLPGTKVR